MSAPLPLGIFRCTCELSSLNEMFPSLGLYCKIRHYASFDLPYNAVHSLITVHRFFFCSSCDESAGYTVVYSVTGYGKTGKNARIFEGITSSVQIALLAFQ